MAFDQAENLELLRQYRHKHFSLPVLYNRK
jgi:hypothetical protein